MTLPAWRGRGYVRAALTKAAALVAGWLWAREGLVISAGEGASSYQKLGWHVADAPVICEQPRGRDTLPEKWRWSCGVMTTRPGRTERSICRECRGENGRFRQRRCTDTSL